MKTFAKWTLVLLAAVGIYVFLDAHYETPILMYHKVGDPIDASTMNVSYPIFEHQMEFLKQHGFKVVKLEELMEAVSTGRKLPKGSVVITFDDGYLDNFKNAFPVLKKLDFPATIFMVTGNIGKPEWLGEEDIKILDASDISIESHTVTHPHLPDLPLTEAVAEINGSKATLESLLGHSVRFFSYPSGGFTKDVRDAVENAGYLGAVTTNRGKEINDKFALRRIKVTNGGKAGLFSFWWKVSGFAHNFKSRVSVPGYEYS